MGKERPTGKQVWGIANVALDGRRQGGEGYEVKISAHVKNVLSIGLQACSMFRTITVVRQEDSSDFTNLPPPGGTPRLPGRLLCPRRSLPEGAGILAIPTHMTVLKLGGCMPGYADGKLKQHP
jgi:hypothetical protein